jgi:sulfite reductase (NADPH) flavoprotein alpha-component
MIITDARTDPGAGLAAVPARTRSPQMAAPSGAVYSRRNPFLAELIRHDRLTRPGSAKDTRHFVLSLGGSGITYAPGDSLGTFGCNPPRLVDELIVLLGFDPNAEVNDPKGKKVGLRDTLLKHYTVNRANRKFMGALAERMPAGILRDRATEIAGNSDLLTDYIETRDYVDILLEFRHARFESPEDFLAQLSPVTPRLYSVASSLRAHPEEAHLCIAVVRYDTHGRAKKGLTSGFYADHTDLFVRNIPVYVQEARTFRLPEDASRDIIMIGPGTGIAPFRAFLEERIATGARGRNWLFFGEQRRATDFLYGHELVHWHQRGCLSRLDLAFSRDQSQRVYVQHRMAEQARDLWAWIQAGAYLYVCGDAKHMARDVHQTLIEIARSHGGLSPEQAADYVNVTLMKTEKRYRRDIY